MSETLIPARPARTELVIAKSRFIASAAPVFSIAEAQAYIRQIRSEFQGATHNVPAYIIGHGASTITHCSDDGEPSGTAGRPALSVLLGSGLGDICVVITRYFGGVKLGSGGLVRAYSDSVRGVLSNLPLARKVNTHTVRIDLPYNWLERFRRLVASHEGQVIDENYDIDVKITARFSIDQFVVFQEALAQASQGSLQAEIIDSGFSIMPITQSPTWRER